MTTEEAMVAVWNYHGMGHGEALMNADLIWVLGSHDLRVADRAAELWREGFAARVLMSGGLGNLTAGVFEKPEADLLAERAGALGVPRDAILMENRSTNTGENGSFRRGWRGRPLRPRPVPAGGGGGGRRSGRWNAPSRGGRQAPARPRSPPVYQHHMNGSLRPQIHGVCFQGRSARPDWSGIAGN